MFCVFSLNTLIVSQTKENIKTEVLFTRHLWQHAFNIFLTVSPDFVAVPIKIFVNETVELATREFKFYNCAATVKKSENTPWVARLICQFCSVTQRNHPVTVNTASADNLDVNVSPRMNRWGIKALFCKLWCMVVWNAPLAFSPRCLLLRRGNCLSFLFINQKMEVNLTVPPPSLFFFFISFMPRNVWWTSFAYVKLRRSIWLSAT